MKQDIVIVAAARTPTGSFCGSLSTVKSHELGTVVIKEVLKRASVDPADLSEVIFGQALTCGQGQNPARQAAVRAGVPLSVPAYLTSVLCGSGLKSVVVGCRNILAGDAKVVLCGGMETMSGAPHFTHMRTGLKLGAATLTDHILSDGLTDAFHNIHMGETAENLATMYKISREEQDIQALESQQRAAKALKEGHFVDEVVPVTVKTSHGEKVFSVDEYPKPNTTLESLAKLEPVFVKLEKAGWTQEDVDLYELNEEFAAQALAVVRELGVDPAKVNVSGGAIALGHPIGASGTRVLVTLLYALRRTGGKRGICSLCVGGGMGIAMAVETV